MDVPRGTVAGRRTRRFAWITSVGSDCTKVSVWAWATKPGGAVATYPNALPQPETISLDGAGLLDVVQLK